MKIGDLVRFKALNLEKPPKEVRWLIGLLVEYNTTNRIALVLYNGNVLSLHPERVQKAGKKDS